MIFDLAIISTSVIVFSSQSHFASINTSHFVVTVGVELKVAEAEAVKVKVEVNLS